MLDDKLYSTTNELFSNPFCSVSFFYFSRLQTTSIGAWTQQYQHAALGDCDGGGIGGSDYPRANCNPYGADTQGSIELTGLEHDHDDLEQHLA